MRRAIASAQYREPHHPPLARLEIELHLAQDRAGEALAAVEDALGRFDLRHSPRYARPLVAAGARACVAAITGPAAARDRDLAARARRLLGRLRAQAGQIEAAGPLEQAHRLTFAAEATQAGDLGGAADAEALAAWDAAATAWQRLSQPYPLAYALLGAAGAAMDSGDRDGAADRLACAAPLADRLGAGPLHEQIGSLARRARLSLPAGPAHALRPGVLRLTAREIEVLRLIAAGHSNRDIAAELFISGKTASVHVSNRTS